MSAYVMNDEMQLLPPGVEGELFVGGEGVSTGYLNRPELTKEKFIIYNSKMLYKSGDIVRLMDCGELEYIGRKDQQVQLRGFRVELGEIEAQLIKHPDIKGAVVTAEEFNENLNLNAYIVTRNEINLVEIKDYLAKSLPYYMIPSYIKQIDEIPLTSNGKVDKNALKKIVATELDDNTEYAQPGNPKEELLVKIWEGILGKEKIGIHDNFFYIGGDSIKSIQIISKIKQSGYKLEFQEIFKYPTIAQLAPLLKKEENNSELLQIRRKGIIPLTPIQQSFLNKQKNNIHHHNQGVLLFTKEAIDLIILEKIFDKLQEHHDALRIIFPKQDDTIVQFNNENNLPLSIESFDFKGRDESNQLLLKLDEIHKSINLEKGPLIKIALFKLSDGYRLAIIIHHLIIDGVSWRILLEDFQTLYFQSISSAKLELPLKTTSFQEWAEKLSIYADNSQFLREKKYWKELSEKELESIKKDTDYCENYIRDTKSINKKLSPQLTELLLGSVNEAFNTKINDVLLTAFGLSVFYCFGIQKFSVDVEGHGRENIINNVDLSRTVGWFTSIYPVIIDVSFHEDLSRQIKEVKETLHQVPNNGIGYGLLKYLTAKEYKIDAGFELESQFLFNYLGQFNKNINNDSKFCFADESIGGCFNADQQRDYAIEINAMIIEKTLDISIRYNYHQFHSDTISSFLDRFLFELEKIIGHCINKDSKELSPSDFNNLDISISEFDAIFE
jgi:non-ribosomal peptide synthase protein (TIGR01720 family)